MPDLEALAAAHIDKMDAVATRYEADVLASLHRTNQAAAVLLDVLAGKSVEAGDQVLAHAGLSPLKPGRITYDDWKLPRKEPVVRLGRQQIPYQGRYEDREAAEKRALAVAGSFFEVRRPSWDFREDGRDVIFVNSIRSFDRPNPTVGFVSVDPESVMYGRSTTMTAGDIGFIPCCYGNHAWTYPRQEMGKLALSTPDLPSSVEELAASVTISQPGKGLELLTRAVERASELPPSSPLGDFAQAYGAQATILG
jgi:hypothetical protein